METRTKHLPQRTCLGCREIKNKWELIRIVRTPQDEIVIDLSGKRAGRGAYLCPVPACWQKGLKGKGLERMLRTNLTPEVLTRLQDFMQRLPLRG